MRGGHAVTLLAGLALAGCSQTVGGAPRWDANVDAPRQEAGPIIFRMPSSGGRTTPGCFAQLLVVFDRSGSMGTVWSSGTVSAPRWQLAEEALTAAITPLRDRLEVGAILFPTSEGEPGSCAVVDPIGAQIDYCEGPAFLSTWADVWSRPDLRGSTPIDAAFDAANDALRGAPEVTAVVLLTDGEPTCSGPVSAIDRAASWHTRGIDTFVIGLPGTGGSAFLAAVASAGGTGSALSVDDPAALTAGLTSILGQQVDQACSD
jgi:hypothetical protein